MAGCVLSVWSIAFLVASFVKQKHLVKGTDQAYQWQMHRLWVIVNLVIVAISIPFLATRWQRLGFESELQYQTAMIIGINVWFDCLYILAGLSMRRTKRKVSGRIRGYGRAIVIQGLFLLFLDAILFQLLMRGLYD